MTERYTCFHWMKTMFLNSCKHINRRNIFGDEINHTKYRQRCTDCGGVVKNSDVDPKGIHGELFADTDALISDIDDVLAEML